MKFNEILEKMREIHDAKNHDYSGGDEFGNFKESERVGVPAWKGAFIRLQDKYSRACNLIRIGEENRKVMDEKLEDTLLDLANYAVIVLSLLTENNKKEIIRSKYKPGDKVIVKNWDEMCAEYGCESFGDIVCISIPGKYKFSSHMKNFCDKEVTIDSVVDIDSDGVGYYRIKEGSKFYIWSDYMFKDDKGNLELSNNWSSLIDEYEDLSERVRPVKK